MLRISLWAPTIIVLSMATSSTLLAEDDSEPETEEILVFGRAIDLVGAADSASEGIVGYDDLDRRPLLRVGELVEVIPGLIATQHSGGGKANQYFLRGMNLDHGTDFSIHFEGMPVNFRSHAHGQGYLDMNFIIPELIQTIEYRKGTYYADVGDFSAASSSKFTTYDRLEKAFLKLSYGTENYFRLVAANSWDVDSGTWLLGAETRLSDGPWDNPEDVHLFNGFAKFSTTFWGRSAEIISTYYRNDWNATDQIPERAWRQGDIGRYGFVDASVGGKTSRFNLIGNMTSENTSYQAFFSKYSLNLFANPTYFLNDFEHGDQIEQEDGRWIIGARIDDVRDFKWGNRGALLQLGVDTRFDNISDVNLYHTENRNRFSTTRNDSVDELSIGVYAAVEVSWTDRFRTTIGMRADHYSWDVLALRSENSGSGSDMTVNPKISVAYGFDDTWEVYANYGGGFHSNDVRVAELSVDPVTGAPAERFEAIVPAKGFETGFRAELSDHFHVSATFFSLELDSELIFVGDAGTTEPNEGTEREGVEATFFWQPSKWLALDLSVAKTNARFSDAPIGQDSIPDAHDVVGSLGTTIAMENGLIGSLRIRHFGEAPLLPNESMTKPGTTLVNLGFSYPIGDFEVGIDVLNLFDVDGNDIEYFYESRLPSEPGPVEDYHFHPVEPREFRLQLRYNF